MASRFDGIDYLEDVITEVLASAGWSTEVLARSAKYLEVVWVKGPTRITYSIDLGEAPSFAVAFKVAALALETWPAHQENPQAAMRAFIETSLRARPGLRGRPKDPERERRLAKVVSMKEAGATREQMADELGVSEDAIKKYLKDLKTRGMLF
jgi:hypothetical protein